MGEKTPSAILPYALRAVRFVIDVSVAARSCFREDNEAWADATGRCCDARRRLVAKRPTAT